MDFLALILVAAPLAALGFLTSAIGSLLVSGSFRSTGGAIAICVVLVPLLILSVFVAYWRNPSVLSRVTYILLAVMDLVGAITSPLVPDSFYDDANYLNRTTYYMFLLIAVYGSLASHWHFVTQRFASVYLEAAGLDVPQETFLYLIWAIFEAFVLSWFVGLTESYSRVEMFRGAVVNSCGFWFFGAISAGGIGLLVLLKGSSGVSTGVSKAASVPESGEKVVPYG
jgi:hypothetical protein